MNDASKGGSKRRGGEGRGRRGFEDPAWLQRLWALQRVPLPPERLHWWSVHVQRFLSFVRAQGLEGPVSVLAGDFLADLRLKEPTPSDWQLDQVRQALEVFGRGIENWQFRPDEQGRRRPAFRVRSQPAGGGSSGGDSDGGSAMRDAGMTELRGAGWMGGEVVRVKGGGVDWRARLVATARLRHYSIRTEQTYQEWVERFLRFHGDAEPLIGCEFYGNRTGQWRYRGYGCRTRWIGSIRRRGRSGRGCGSFRRGDCRWILDRGWNVGIMRMRRGCIGR
jgi:hypothetical protein